MNMRLTFHNSELQKNRQGVQTPKKKLTKFAVIEKHLS